MAQTRGRADQEQTRGIFCARFGFSGGLECSRSGTDARAEENTPAETTPAPRTWTKDALVQRNRADESAELVRKRKGPLTSLSSRRGKKSQKIEKISCWVGNDRVALRDELEQKRKAENQEGSVIRNSHKEELVCRKMQLVRDS